MYEQCLEVKDSGLAGGEGGTGLVYMLVWAKCLFSSVSGSLSYNEVRYVLAPCRVWKVKGIIGEYEKLWHFRLKTFLPHGIS